MKGTDKKIEIDSGDKKGRRDRQMIPIRRIEIDDFATLKARFSIRPISIRST